MPASRAAGASSRASGGSSISGATQSGAPRRSAASTAARFDAAERKLRRKTHDTISRVTVDVEQRIHLNTAISALMELVNEMYAFGDAALKARPARPQSLRPRCARRSRRWSIMMSPFAPHTAEELWEMTGHAGGIAKASWPSFDEEVAKADEIVVPVQVNGKLRSRLTVPADTPESELRERALADPAVRPHIDGKTIKSVVVVKGKLINVVVAVGGRCSCGSWRRRSPRTDAGMRWRAAVISCRPTSARSASRTFENHTSFFQMAQLVTDKVRTEFIGRGNYKIVPEATGADAVLVGAVTDVAIVPTNFSARAAGLALHDYRDGQHPAARRAEGHRALEQPRHLDSRGIRRDELASRTIPTASSIPPRSSTQESNALERISNEFSRSVVSAILEAF